MPARLRRISADIGIVTSDLARSLQFYIEVLGFRHAGKIEIRGVGTMYRLESEGTAIKVIDSAAPGLPRQLEPAAGLTLATGLRYFTLHVENLDEVVALCSSVLVGPTGGDGMRFAMVLDPDRVVVELAERPGDGPQRPA
jgi:catechol 2,3-dioxygenase-like lactoylglutathione lyase family enzyme